MLMIILLAKEKLKLYTNKQTNRLDKHKNQLAQKHYYFYKRTLQQIINKNPVPQFSHKLKENTVQVTEPKTGLVNIISKSTKRKWLYDI